MKKLILYAALLSIGLTSVPAEAEVNISADMVSRYVWRGADFGNAASIQPGISYSTGAFEVGAWSSWALVGNSAGEANENDLYVSFAAGPVSITVTDYYFPEPEQKVGSERVLNVSDNGDSTYTKRDVMGPADFFDINHHTIEIAAGFEAGNLSFLAGMMVLGDAADNDIYLEVGMDLGTIGDADVGVVLGAGNKVYAPDGFMACNVGLNVSQGDYFGSYVINPDTKTPYLFIGKRF